MLKSVGITTESNEFGILVKISSEDSKPIVAASWAGSVIFEHRLDV